MLKNVSAEKEVRVCDECGSEIISFWKCGYCEKELCQFCTAFVTCLKKDIVRGHTLVWKYRKAMCQAHLPIELDWSDIKE